MEFHQPLGADTTHRITIDRALSGQVLAPVFDSVDVIALFIQFISVDIKFVAILVG